MGRILRCSAGTGSGADRRAGTGAGERGADSIRTRAVCGTCRNGLVRCERCFRSPCSAGAGHFLRPHGSKKDDSVSAEKRELVKAMRERVKSLLGTLSEKYFASGPKQWLAECRQADAALCELVDLALLFGERLTEKSGKRTCWTLRTWSIWHCRFC